MNALITRSVFLISVITLAGCASQEDFGPTPTDLSPSVFQSASVQQAVQQYEQRVSANNDQIPWSCPVEKTTWQNRCSGWFDNVFLGPVGYIFAEANGYSETPKIVRYTRYKNNGGIFSLAGAFMPVTGVQSFIGSLILSSRLDDSSTWGESKNAFAIQKTIYQKNAKQLSSGKYVWVGRFFPLPLTPSNLWSQDFNSSLHHLAMLASSADEKPIGWASLSVNGVPYKITNCIWSPATTTRGVFNYQFAGPTPKDLPAVYPTTFYWLHQAWKDPQKAGIVVPGPSKSEPFMALAAMMYRVESPDAILPWIKAHQAQLSGWTVVYHLDGKTWAWKNGAAHPVTLPPITS